MTVFIDTSAVYAYIDRSDRVHSRAYSQFESLVTNGTGMLTTNYVVLESCALVQRRFGAPGMLALFDDIVPMFDLHSIDRDTHSSAVTALLSSGKQGLSLVDLSSFETMRRLGIRDVFTFDRHFRERGFNVIP